MSGLTDLLYRPLEWPIGYKLAQWFFHPTVKSYRAMIAGKMNFAPQEKLLDLGCGIGNFRPYLKGIYTGVDFNPAYIETCRKRFPDTFKVMDATQLAFADGEFDQVAAVALCHHLSDEQCTAMFREALRVLGPKGRLHVIDPVLPRSPFAVIKTLILKLDRGRFGRSADRLAALLNSAGVIEQTDEYEGPMHDVFYARVRQK